MSFPPSQKILHLQIKRACHVSKLYQPENDSQPCIDVELIFHRWKLSSRKSFLELHWFRGDQVPQAIEDDTSDATEDDTGDISQDENIDSNYSDTNVTDEVQSQDEDETFDLE